MSNKVCLAAMTLALSVVATSCSAGDSLVDATDTQPSQSTATSTTVDRGPAEITLPLPTEPAVAGAILVRSGNTPRLVDGAGELIREREYAQRVDVGAVLDGGCVLVQVGRQSWHLTTTDLLVDSEIGAYESPPFVWSSLEASDGAVAVESGDDLIVIDTATCSVQQLPAGTWPWGYVAADGVWLIHERDTAGSAVALVDSRTGAVTWADYGWATVEMAESLTGLPLPRLRGAERVSAPVSMSDGAFAVIALNPSSPDGGGWTFDVVVVEPNGDERLRIPGPLASVPILDAGLGVVVVQDEQLGQRYDVIDLHTGRLVGDFSGQIVMADWQTLGDFVITTNRASDPSVVLNVSTGAADELPDGRIRAISPDGNWFAIQDSGTIIAPVDDVAAGVWIADGIPVAWLAYAADDG